MISRPNPLTTPDVKDVTDALIYQLMSVMGLKKPNWITRCLYPLFHTPANYMSILLVNLDRDIAQIGWNPAIKKFLGVFVTDVKLDNPEVIPKRGPLMVVGNHPAAFDIVILASAIQRDDLQIIISDIPIIQMLPNIAAHCIPVPYHIPSRLRTVRGTIQHLKNDGAIFIFPRGNVEPDPTVSPGAEKSLSGWSSSIELFLRQVPRTKTVIAISSGMLSRKWFNNPLIKQWKKYEQRQKVAEIFQIASQILTRKKPANTPMVNFSFPQTVDDLGGVDSPEGTLLGSITDQARHLLSQHPQRLN